VGRLDQELLLLLLEHRERELRPRDPDLPLDAWAHDYRFDRRKLTKAHKAAFVDPTNPQSHPARRLLQSSRNQLL
jgi:hypothetical protein